MVIADRAEFIGQATNNEAEYRVLAGLLACATLWVPRVHCHSDSQVMVRHLPGENKVKDPVLKPLWARVRELAAGFAEFFAHVPRSDPEISRAGFLANQALDVSNG